MNRKTNVVDKVDLLWLYPGKLATALDAATWLDTTRALRQIGWGVTLVAAGKAGLQSIKDVDVFCLQIPDIYLLRQVLFHLGFYRVLTKIFVNVDVILTDQMSAPWLIPLRVIRSLMKRTRPLLVMDIRSLHMPMRSKQGVRGRLREEFQKIVNRKALSWVDGCVAITPRIAEFLEIPSGKLWGTWPSGVNAANFDGVFESRKWPSRNDTVRLIYIGALHFERNLMNLCRAVNQANKNGMSFEFYLVGKGDEMVALDEFASQTQGMIRVLPPVAHNQIPKLLSQAHVGTLPFPDEPKFRVSSPIKLFEYMAAGMPMLATRISCHTDVLDSDDCVFWAEGADNSGLMDALQNVWQNKDKFNVMGAKAKAAARSWTWRASANKLKVAIEKGIIISDA